MLLDVHTHRLPDDASTALLSCSLRDVPLPEEARFLSVGIHPWYITREDYGSQMKWVERMLDDRRVIALGGSGSGQAVCYAVRLAAGGVPVCGAAGRRT